MTQEEKYKIISNEYADLIIEYNENQAILDRYVDASPHIINVRHAVIYIPQKQWNENIISNYGYMSIPNCYGLVSERDLEASGINELRRITTLNLRGRGVLVGIVDTGIDYTNQVFLHKDGTSKVVSLWDQTINSVDKYPVDTYFGTEYTMEDINLALQSGNPFEIVPSKDEIGHGTMLAGVAAGSENNQANFSGVVPDAELVVVKLKQAKPLLREFLSIPLDVPCYQENDIIWGVRYLTRVARRLGRPLAICIGLGTTQGSHTGLGFLDNVVSVTSQFPGVAISVAVGNEGLARNHYYGVINPAEGYRQFDLNVGSNEPGFAMEIWGNMPGIYSIDIISPLGEYVPRIIESLRVHRTITFIFDKTIINVDYILVERRIGNQLILLRFQDPTPGIWIIRVYGRGDLQQSFHAWLPLSGFITNETYFVQSDPYTTITSPSDADAAIAVTAYNALNDSLYQNAGRGFTVFQAIKPTLAAPGVDTLIPNLEQSFSVASGTSIAAAHMSGITAMLLEWGIVRGNYPGLNTVDIKKFLIRGAKRSAINIYPNRHWGFGIVDIYGVYDEIRTEI